MIYDAIVVIETYGYDIESVMRTQTELFNNILPQEEYKNRFDIIGEACINAPLQLDLPDTFNYHIAFNYLVNDIVTCFLNKSGEAVEVIIQQVIDKTFKLMSEFSFLNVKKEEVVSRPTKRSIALRIFEKNFNPTLNNHKEVKRLISDDLDISKESATTLFYQIKKEIYK